MKTRPTSFLVAVALAGGAGSAFAWDGFGHMVVAAAAYRQLQATPAARVRVDALVKLNPDYATWVAGVPASQRAQVAFLMASRWPDAIKSDSRYFSDGSDNGETAVEPVASRNVGYTDKARHKYWHYKDNGFSTDGTPLQPPQQPNVETQIVRFRATLASAQAGNGLKSYDLVWLVHLVGDAHQPLHASTRFTADRPDGDVGGNKVAVHCATACASELHAFWDDLLDMPGSNDVQAAVVRAQGLPAAPAGQAAITNVATWMAESMAAAKADVYVAPVGAAAHGPYTLDAAYRQHAADVAGQRVALAGARLARLLRDALK